MEPLSLVDGMQFVKYLAMYLVQFNQRLYVNGVVRIL